MLERVNRHLVMTKDLDPELLYRLPESGNRRQLTLHSAYLLRGLLKKDRELTILVKKYDCQIANFRMPTLMC